ncbi:MAG TPA: fatty acid desaturase [Verrucomicrobiae bacterium]|jgi:omega-6 fatty acid desaturase (delta-12 desaturase)|nr:fatty acid desaturase [Verrucomicrobiae bacterium]
MATDQLIPQIATQEFPPVQKRTGRDLILATRQFAIDDPLRSWWHLLSTSFLFLAALAGTIWNFHPVARVACSLLTGLLLLRLFVIYHDQQHHAILPNSRLAEGLMKLFGILALSPSSVWRSSHNHHHNHNSRLRGSQIGSYPIMTREQFRKTPPSKRRSYLFVRHPLTILFGYAVMFLYGMCLNPFFNHPRKHFDCLVAFVVHCGIGAALLYFGGWTALLFVQVIPHFVASAIGSYLFYAQHNFPGVSFNDSAGWTYEKAALESSSFMRTGRLMGWFTANIGYHHIHHLNSRIPFYRLPEVHRMIPELRSSRTTSLHPGEILRCLRLKVWDVETQRMVGVRNL